MRSLTPTLTSLSLSLSQDPLDTTHISVIFANQTEEDIFLREELEVTHTCQPRVRGTTRHYTFLSMSMLCCCVDAYVYYTRRAVLDHRANSSPPPPLSSPPPPLPRSPPRPPAVASSAYTTRSIARRRNGPTPGTTSLSIHHAHIRTLPLSLTPSLPLPWLLTSAVALSTKIWSRTTFPRLARARTSWYAGRPP